MCNIYTSSFINFLMQTPVQLKDSTITGPNQTLKVTSALSRSKGFCTKELTQSHIWELQASNLGAVWFYMAMSGTLGWDCTLLFHTAVRHRTFSVVYEIMRKKIQFCGVGFFLFICKIRMIQALILTFHSCS